MNSHDAMPVPSTSRRTTLSFEAVFSETALASDGRQIKRQRRQAANSDNWLRKLDRCQVLGDGSERHHYTEIPHYGHLGCVVGVWHLDLCGLTCLECSRLVSGRHNVSVRLRRLPRVSLEAWTSAQC
jgi:hypothetical protein